MTRQDPWQRFSFGLDEYRDLELSTQVLIRAARERGLEAEVLDRSSNTLRLHHRTEGRSEIVVQGTKTSADSYVCTEIMGLKKVTKLLLAEAGLPVPQGQDYQSMEQALADWPRYEGQLRQLRTSEQAFNLIVKPNSTNYGIGISQLEAGHCSLKDYRQALERAFSHDQSILIEEFIPGKEYRFLVIDGRLRAVLHRIPANVTGDGQNNIAALVAAKNGDPWRVGPQGSHISPLETIELNTPELEILREQGLSPKSVPQVGEQIFLRHNSNISTGGDSLDMTDVAHPGYGTLAQECAQVLGAKICGVDVISTDITADPNQTGHAIIEANFNPVLYFHEYPAEGRPRSVASAVVELLFPHGESAAGTDKT
ncbi:hypothetical protein P0082_11680 [Candidatus Haliotispira prima]|uniref:Glutamate--cysteine ligase n=1 Tax=Candidatus Haliotispira prima TaxID=3034016 RepID=A0ABY8MGJ3_9SPIO|nr:hypothetical protein P0082_11680 [Candidatus Haliotispira prima]